MRLTGLLLVLAVTSCSGRTPVGPQVSAVIGDTFAVRVGQQVTFDGESLRIFFEAVGEDSRCPTQVTCVWEGNGRVRLRAVAGDSSARVDLNTAHDPRAVVVLGYHISLERLEPQPVAGTPIPEHRYVAHLNVTRP